VAEQRQTTKIALIIVLGVVLGSVLLVRSGLLPFGSRKGAGSATATQDGKGDKSSTPGTKGTQATPPSAQVKWKKPEPVGPVVNDPMRMELPPEPTQKTQTAEKPPEEPEYRLAGIVYSTEQPSSVIIDGHILHEGDTIHGATVVKIAENYVILRRGDKTWTIKAGQTNKEPE
jgi:hypothetical protein